MKFMVVIDTNVLVSALLSKHDDAATVQILNLVFDGTIIPVYNAEILDELLTRWEEMGYHVQPLEDIIRTPSPTVQSQT